MAYPSAVTGGCSPWLSVIKSFMTGRLFFFAGAFAGTFESVGLWDRIYKSGEDIFYVNLTL